MKLYVTANDADGEAVFARDGAPLRSTAFPDGGGFEELWVTRAGAPLGDADAIVDGFPFFPGAGDTRFRIVRLVPGYLERAAAGEGGAASGADTGADVLEADAPGMHTTDSIDFGIVLAGEVELFRLRLATLLHWRLLAGHLDLLFSAGGRACNVEGVIADAKRSALRR